MIVISGTASVSLGIKVANMLGVDSIPVESKIFPDGEYYFRVPKNVEGKDTVIIQTTGPPQNTNLLQLLFLTHAVRDLGARSVTVVIPYLAYARQDKRFRPGEVLSIQSVLKLLKGVNPDRIITFNIHNPKVLDHFGCRFENLSAIPILAEFLRKKGLKEPFSLAPDEGAMDIVQVANAVLKGGYGWLKKRRNRLTGEISFENFILKSRKKDAVIFDDIISTGGTMASAVKILKDQGVRRVYVACVHPLLTEGVKEKILRNGAEDVIGTDSVNSSVSVVSLAPLIVKALRK